MDIDRRDLFDLRQFGADLDSDLMRDQYSKIRARYERAHMKGKLPSQVLLLLAAEYPDYDIYPDEKPADPPTITPGPAVKKKKATKRKPAAA